MIRNAQIGEMVEILDTITSSTAWRMVDGMQVLVYDYLPENGNTGEILRVLLNTSPRGKTSVCQIYVGLTPPNKGVMPFRPKQLRRIDA